MPHTKPGDSVSSKAEKMVNCYKKWQELLRDDHRSVPASSGRIAICYSATDSDEARLLRTHAAALAARHAKARGSSELVDVEAQISVPDLRAIIGDPKVASIIVLGHGAIGNLQIQEKSREFYHNFDWKQFSAATTHLKTGIFEQRTCAHFPEFQGPVHIALGSFVVADQSKIFAPVGAAIDTSQGINAFDAAMVQVYPRPQNTLDQLALS